MLYKKLKSDIFIVGKDTVNEIEVERYLVENKKDVDNFFKVFSDTKNILYDIILANVNNGQKIILTDRTISGFPSWCTETSHSAKSNHPSNFYRKL